MTLTAGQCRAARALIGWSQDQLASESKVAKATIANFEAGKRESYARTLDDIREALESAGVEFTNGGQPGVRMKLQPSIEVIEQRIAEVRERMPTVDPAAEPSPEKGMRLLQRAKAKNELVKLKNRRAKLKGKK
jgi:transcriptional regulator with XRE-family HTH domain